MNNNQEILDLFGVYVVSQVYDDSMKYLNELIEGSTKWGTVNSTSKCKFT